MRVLELTLRNFRVFAEQQFRFADRFTVVAGINGRGKTALLDALALLCSRFLPQVSPARGYRTMAPSELHMGAQDGELTMKVNCAGIWKAEVLNHC